MCLMTCLRCCSFFFFFIIFCSLNSFNLGHMRFFNYFERKKN